MLRVTLLALLIPAFWVTACSPGERACYDPECQDDSLAFIEAFGLQTGRYGQISFLDVDDQGARLVDAANIARACLTYGIIGPNGEIIGAPSETRRRSGNPDIYTILIQQAGREASPETYRIHHKNALFRLSPALQQLLNSGECLPADRLVLVPSETSETGALLTVRIWEL